MAIDTLKIMSPGLAVETGLEIERASERIQKVLPGEVLEWQLTTAHPRGSWETSVTVRVVYDVKEPGRKTTNDTEGLRAFVSIEGSVHKALAGHNVYGGPEQLLPAARWFVSDVAGRLGVPLPDGAEWRVHRADWAEVYDLGGADQVKAYIMALNQARYPRRDQKVVRYGDQSFYAPGSVSTIKAYHKGPELVHNDGPRLRQAFSSEEWAQVSATAWRVCRWEVECKSRKFKADFGGVPLVSEVPFDYLSSVHFAEVGRVIREAKSDMDTVHTAREVRARLQEVYGKRRARGIYASWVLLASQGETESRSDMSRATFYRHRKLMAEAGCAIHGTDMRHLLDVAPIRFVPGLAAPQRLRGELPIIQQKLAA